MPTGKTKTAPSAGNAHTTGIDAVFRLRDGGTPEEVAAAEATLATLNPLRIGASVLIRGCIHYAAGVVAAFTPDGVILAGAQWVALTGKWGAALASGRFEEAEAPSNGVFHVSWGGICDVHELGTPYQIGTEATLLVAAGREACPPLSITSGHTPPTGEAAQLLARYNPMREGNRAIVRTTTMATDGVVGPIIGQGQIEWPLRLFVGGAAWVGALGNVTDGSRTGEWRESAVAPTGVIAVSMGGIVDAISVRPSNPVRPTWEQAR